MLLKMNKQNFHIIYLVFIFFLFPISGNTFSNSFTYSPAIELTLSDIIQIPWSMPLREVEKKYPGGKLIEGNSEKRIVSSYFFNFYLKDLKRKSNLNLHIPPKSSNIEGKSPKLIKSLKIFCQERQAITETIEKIKIIIKIKFPNGGPIWKADKQVGYFIPTTDNFSGISIRWSAENRTNSIHVTIQDRE